MLKFRAQLAMGVAFIFFLGCGSAGDLSSLGLKTGQSISLKATDGSIPVTLFFEDAPVSQSGTQSGTPSQKTTDVTFTGSLDVRQATSPNAFSAIQGLAEIAIELRFINTKREVKKFELSPIKQGEALVKPITRNNIPFALEDISQIVFVVDLKEVAFFPPLTK